MTDRLKDKALAESRDLLARVAGLLQGMDRRTGPAKAEEINSCYRALHTIAGLAGHLGFVQLQSLAKLAENVLEDMRTTCRSRGDARIHALLRAVARMQEIVNSLANGTEPVADVADIGALLDELRAWHSPRLCRPAWYPVGARNDPMPRYFQYGNQIPSGPPRGGYQQRMKSLS